MKQGKIRFLPALFFFAVTIGGSGAAGGQVTEGREDCSAPTFALKVPPYSIEVKEHDASEPPVLDLQVSIPTEAVNEEQMVALACRLASLFPREGRIYALVFDDKSAARHLALTATDQPHHGVYLWHLKGRYVLDRRSKQQFVEFLSPTLEKELLALKRRKIWITGD